MTKYPALDEQNGECSALGPFPCNRWNRVSVFGLKKYITINYQKPRRNRNFLYSSSPYPETKPGFKVLPLLKKYYAALHGLPQERSRHLR